MGLAIMTSGFLLGIASQRIAIIDDAWITFRHAFNLGFRGELVFNVGERVEGITNLLWAVVLATVSRLFSMPVPMAATVVALALLAWTMFRLWRFGQAIGLGPLVATLPSLILVLTPDYLGAFTNGLEVPLFSALLLEATYQYAQGRQRAAFAAAGLLFATRPESAVIGLLLAGMAYLDHKVLHGETNRTMDWGGLTLFFGIVFATTLFRLGYYGDFIPNSLRAKLFPMSMLPWGIAAQYVFEFGRANPHFVIIAFAALAYVAISLPHSRSVNSRRWGIILFSVSCLTYSVVVAVRNGGDWMPNFRLLAQYGVVYSILFIALIGRGVIPLPVAVTIFIVPLVQTTQLAFTRMQQSQDFRLVTYDANWAFWGEAAQRVAPVLSPSDKVSAEAIGYISYQLIDNYVHDPLGLTDSYLARYGRTEVSYGKSDINYTLGTIRPAVLIWHWAGHLQSAKPELLEDYGVFCYAECNSWRANIVMIRRDRLNDLSSAFFNWKAVTANQLQP